MTVKEYFLLENGKPFFVSECYSNNRLDSEPSVKKNLCGKTGNTFKS